MPTTRLTNIRRLYPMASTPSAAAAEVVSDAALHIQDGRITWLGPQSEAPKATPEDETIDLNGAIVTPGWIDCHTHLIWAGSRQQEFRQRIEGKSYLEIAQAGGGIMSTARAVRETSLEDLLSLARPRLQRMLSFGVTTAEVKSGYGLSTEAELRMLQAARALHQEGPLTLHATFLGAHTVPVEYRDKRDAYIDLVCQEMIPQVAAEQLAEGCDVFVEESAFSLQEAEKVLSCGIDHGLVARVHADQLSPGGGAQLAASLKAASADHLEEIDQDGIRALADADVVACMIPGSTFCLNQHKFAPARAILDAGVTLAIATDLNPGTTCSENLALMGTIACARMRLTPLEVLHAITRAAATSLRQQHNIGSLKPGYQADITVLNAPDIEYVFYHYGVSHVQRVFKHGRTVWSSPTTQTQTP